MKQIEIEEEKTPINAGFSEGIWIDRIAWEEDSLTLTEKLFYAVIIQLCKNKYGCYAGNKWFSRFFNLGESACSEYIGRLLEKEYITAKMIYAGKQIKKRILYINPKKEFTGRKNSDSEIRGGSSEIRVSRAEIRGGSSETTQENIIYNKIENKTISNEIEQPKEVDPAFPKKKKEITEEFPKNELVDYWYTISPFTKSKGPATKTYQKAARMLRQLQQGIFYKNKLDPGFLLKHAITKDIINKKWTQEEIKDGMVKLAEGLKTNPKLIRARKYSLENLLYLPTHSASYFLRYACEELKKVEPKNKEIVKKYLEFMKNEIKTQHDRNQMTSIINGLISEVEIIYKKVEGPLSHTQFSSHFGTSRNPAPFFDKYIAFLKKRQEHRSINGNSIKVDSFCWNDFIKAMEKEYGYQFSPDPATLKKMKEEAARGEAFIKRMKSANKNNED